ncbi:hypothetical protein GN956_G6840 [Arapaima gigas]
MPHHFLISMMAFCIFICQHPGEDAQGCLLVTGGVSSHWYPKPRLWVPLPLSLCFLVRIQTATTLHKAKWAMATDGLMHHQQTAHFR